jgi:hypothetical protein
MYSFIPWRVPYNIDNNAGHEELSKKERVVETTRVVNVLTLT